MSALSLLGRFMTAVGRFVSECEVFMKSGASLEFAQQEGRTEMRC